MTREEIIRNLKYTMEKHKNDTVSTFSTNISLMCKDILDYLEQESCEDAISRQAAIEAVIDLCKYYTPTKSVYHPHMDFVIEALQDLPPVTPQQKTGQWQQDLDGTYLCSECGSGFKEQPTLMGKPMFAWCPSCGAKMEVR